MISRGSRLAWTAVTPLLPALLVTLALVGPANAAQRPVHVAGDTAGSGTLTPISDRNLPLEVLLPRQVRLGAPALIRVHTAQRATVRIDLLYPDGSVHGESAGADAGGALTRRLQLPAGLLAGDSILVHVQALDETRHAFWQGTLHVGLPLPPTLVVTPLAARLTAGYHARVAVQTAPNVVVRFTGGIAGGAVSGGTVQADNQGHAFIIMTTPAALAMPATFWVNALASTPQGTIHSTASLVLVPRPALPLTVVPAAASVEAGHQETLAIHSVAAAQVGISLTYPSGAEEHLVGQTDDQGRYQFSITTPISQSHAVSVAVTVHAVRGVDTGAATTTFSVRPAPTVLAYVKSLGHKAAPGVPLQYAAGKVIIVSLQEQALRAYENGKLMLFVYVTTGRPELPTVGGVFHIYEKVSPYQFHSPWPLGSRFYYPPTWIHYWMPFFEGYGLHDAWWRYRYGPGTNTSGDGVASGEPTGTHGCVNIPFAATQWLWNWAPVGTTVVVY
ncbi:MAG: hypothetical protein NVSMB65_04650 [Chloroflexota bacterium]